MGPEQRIATRKIHLQNLLAFKSMVSAHSLVVFANRDSLRTDLLPSFYAQVPNAGLLPSTTDYALGCLYQGSGGKHIGDLLVTFTFSSSRNPEARAQAPWEADDLAVPIDVEPPAYDQIQLPSPKKPAFVNPASSSSEIEQPPAVADQLRHEILNHPTAPGSPTEDGFVLDRFHTVERRLCARGAGSGRQVSDRQKY
ncbi:hypothetical protein SLS56_011156 [Neofusicoccum ribis]|uniref:Uncharacterized protein n=1 Tax=Neofusicoccum ribis TaxID=45134 RepID=A0ABR3SCC9_9PEZI